MKDSIEGTVHIECIDDITEPLHHGKVNGREIVLDKRVSFRGITPKTPQTFIYEWLVEHQDKLDGKRVRITIETIKEESGNE